MNIEINHYGPHFILKDVWTKEARKLTGRPNIKIYWDEEFHYVQVMDNDKRMFSMGYWDEKGREKLRIHAQKLRYHKYDNWRVASDELYAGQARDKQRMEDDWNRETFDDIQKYGIREARSLTLS